MHRTLVLGVSLLTCFALRPAPGQDHPKTVTTKAAKSRGELDAPDENIKHGRALNDPYNVIPAPAAKGGEQTRESACRIHVDNRTPWSIDIYTDGGFRGTIAPWDDMYGNVGCGNTTFYGRAVFKGDVVQTWGPTVSYVDSALTWFLTQ